MAKQDSATATPSSSINSLLSRTVTVARSGPAGPIETGELSMNGSSRSETISDGGIHLDLKRVQPFKVLLIGTISLWLCVTVRVQFEVWMVNHWILPLAFSFVA